MISLILLASIVSGSADALPRIMNAYTAILRSHVSRSSLRYLSGRQSCGGSFRPPLHSASPNSTVWKKFSTERDSSGANQINLLKVRVCFRGYAVHVTQTNENAKHLC